jgi:hypothetical protein
VAAQVEVVLKGIQVLVKRGSNAGQTLVKRWSNAGQSDGRKEAFFCGQYGRGALQSASRVS